MPFAFDDDAGQDVAGFFVSASLLHFCAIDPTSGISPTAPSVSDAVGRITGYTHDIAGRDGQLTPPSTN